MYSILQIGLRLKMIVCLNLADKKWSEGFSCSKCKHIKFTTRKKNYARDCNRCHCMLHLII